MTEDNWPITAFVDADGAPIVERAGPSFPALVMNKMLCFFTTLFIVSITFLQDKINIFKAQNKK